MYCLVDEPRDENEDEREEGRRRKKGQRDENEDGRDWVRRKKRQRLNRGRATTVKSDRILLKDDKDHPKVQYIGSLMYARADEVKC